MAPAPYPIPLRGSECQSERAPALGENAFWSRILDCGRETERHGWIDKTAKSLSKWSLLKRKSCHLAREEWFCYWTRQFFNEIAILWKKSSILNDEAITSRVNVRVKRKSEKQRQTQWTNIHGKPPHTLSLIRINFFVSNSYLIVISERCSYHTKGKFRLSWALFRSRLKTSITYTSAIKI